MELAGAHQRIAHQFGEAFVVFDQQQAGRSHDGDSTDGLSAAVRGSAAPPRRYSPRNSCAYSRLATSVSGRPRSVSRTLPLSSRRAVAI